MQIGIVSDSHDNIWNLEAALTLMSVADATIHCGDLCSPFILERLARMLDSIPIHVVWGNNDGDMRLISQVADEYQHVKIHGAFASLELDGLRVAVNHYPDIARPIASSGEYDVVCYGHDHTAHHSKVGDCTLLNPGELMGMNGSATFAWFDTQTHEVRFSEVG